ncbi:helix-turn-helix domain-containing protein [uncultured Draconibacterium sp.]|uniref:helix-turn-helix domain-containing protein n=1 Tax=uncultured Draconibacterium sp. TaxID=1573823 RepID=UPI002AA807C4|nr:helix-turn-helix domain-containing protein [uncultured Draconibacterium sp.]
MKEMEALKYTVIKTEEQYNNYCNTLENLISEVSPALDDEIELLTLLIEKWDSEHSTFNDLDPVQLIKSLMEENNMKAVGLAKLLGLSKGTVSKILNYQKGLSKETIRKLSDNFQISQEAFNRPYKLKNEINRQFRDASLMNTKKDLGASLAI